MFQPRIQQTYQKASCKDERSLRWKYIKIFLQYHLSMEIIKSPAHFLSDYRNTTFLSCKNETSSYLSGKSFHDLTDPTEFIIFRDIVHISRIQRKWETRFSRPVFVALSNRFISYVWRSFNHLMHPLLFFLPFSHFLHATRLHKSY